MQKLLSLGLAAAILYNIFQLKSTNLTSGFGKNNLTANPAISSDEDHPEAEITGSFIEKTLSKVLLNALKTQEGRLFLENIVGPANKPLANGEYTIKINNKDLLKNMFRISNFGEGKIGPALCGHIITAHYQIMTLNNNIVDEQTKTFTLGARSVLPGLDGLIVGMMIGQSRQAILPAKLAYAEHKYQKPGLDPNSSYKVNVMLRDILPKNFIKDEEVKIFDDEVAYKIPLMCGDAVTFDAVITQIKDGKILFDSSNRQKISLNIGNINYPLIFSYALHNKVAIGSRTVIAKGKTFIGLGNGYSQIFPKTMLAAEEYFMLELKNFVD